MWVSWTVLLRPHFHLRIPSSSATKSPVLLLIQKFRTQSSPISKTLNRQRRTIKDLDQTKVVKVEQTQEKHLFRLLIKPTLFTVGFVGCSYVTCALWQYESKRRQIRKVKDNWLKKTIDRHSSSMFGNIWRDIPESKRLVGKIIALNVIVFLLWRRKSLEPFLLKYFTSSPFKPYLSSMILSTFSHYNAFHLFCNMYVLWSFSEPVVHLFGKEQFVATFLSGGIISTLASYVFKIVTKTPNISLGASGSLMTVLGAVCMQFPTAQLSIIFLPFFTFSAQSALMGMISLDVVGTVLRWKFLDHAAHLGGVLYGVWYVKYGYKILWESLTPFIEHWHNLREKLKKS